MKRREFLRVMLGAAGVVVLLPLYKTENVFAENKASPSKIAKMKLGDKEWKARLTKEQYEILRKEYTERPFSSDLLDEHRYGTFNCVACDLPLFLSQTKFDSGTGWPSFFAAIDGHIETKTDYKIGVPRTEYHCARCEGHHGHVFDDGPDPTGLRYCNNGAVLKFIPKGK